jgi:hypothetical protein
VRGIRNKSPSSPSKLNHRSLSLVYTRIKNDLVLLFEIFADAEVGPFETVCRPQLRDAPAPSRAVCSSMGSPTC